MPGQVPPSRQQVQAVVAFPVARSTYGSLNRSKMTASLPLNALATPVQNDGANWASGIGFWQVAFTSEQPAEFPVYCPKLQCISTIGVMPLLIRRFTYVLTAFWYVVPPNCDWTGETPSQHCSLSGIRT